MEEIVMEKLNSSNFDKVLQSEFALVDFSASWCGPCRMLKPILEELETTTTGVAFYNVDVDECEEVARDYRIFSIPTLMIFKQGQLTDTSVGFSSKDELEDFINKNR